MQLRLALIVLGLLGSSQLGWADESADYVNRIKPVLQSRCYACHGVLKQEGGLRLDSGVFAVKGGDSGAVVKPGDADGSVLIQRIASKDDATRMPPEGEPLKPDEILAIQAWIVQGAVAPTDEAPERDPREHWAFQPPVRPVVPTTTNPAWSRNPIDAFIGDKHRREHLTPQPHAARDIWLRRVTLDLTGLPPTAEEQQAFMNDESEQAVETVVNRLLDSPQYGERWGRHWMDIWRYSDWWGLGEDARNSQKHIWHWRDWIIESLNADKGYDQMLREMLAADELYPDDPDRLRAGGFLGRQYFKFNRTSWMDETIEHTAKAMLGLTFNCAKCHDHKYDPFSQADYYRFRAIFEPYQVRLDATNGVIDFEKDGIPRPFDCNLDTKTYLHLRGDDRNPDTSRVMEPAFPAFLTTAASAPAIEPITLPAVAVQPGLRAFVVEAYLQQAERKIADMRHELSAARVRLSESEHREESSSALQPQNTGAVLVHDDFSAVVADRWEQRDGTWNYDGQKLIQSKEGPVRAELRLKQLPPDDFEVKLKFTPTGGQTWKSVGITFDGTDSNELLAYLSAHSGGSKAQFAYKKGAYVYPGEAAKPLPIELNRPYELTLRVRDTLINLLVDGELAVSFRSPVPRQRGALQIITYDAKAEIQSFQLKALSSATQLIEATSGKVPADAILPIDQARLALSVAQKSLAWAETQPALIRARAAADQARYAQPPADNALELARGAAREERLAALAKTDEELVRAELELRRAPADKKSEPEKKLATARTAHEMALKTLDEPGESFTSLRGASKVLESNLETEDSRLKPFPATSSGRRTALAKWITDPRHPLTARVAVNHIWARHFGRPLVPTVFDFGRKGATPTHPELLDWLAIELMQGGQDRTNSAGWSMKHIHRLIVTSETYRLSSSNADAASENRRRDPDNQFYWRMNPIRMQSQVVRDALLRLADELDLTMGGPSIPIQNESSRRRSLYFIHSNILREKFLSMFDDASVLDCYRRAESIVPQQALALENSPLAIEMATKIAHRLTAAHPSATDRDFIRIAFNTVLATEPTAAELDTVLEVWPQFIEAAKLSNKDNPQQQARINIVQALLNHNDFVTIR
ncbi:PSD1 and planctomycete cytochrome C domain-containing protein [Schlesneria paludicola]|uniref:PSD1 and planctomycete cytochrome C domain-containing protein n=1 Tax=Schlesneria paludicola TaxID=360056 RepID=UPI00029B2ECB|nr:PSD1 and planctomycete cytochrome C domain-containing protein [Schlesneria paludicola]